MTSPLSATDRRIMQTAFVVDDIEAACMNWVRVTGIGPFLLVPHIELAEFDYRGAKGEGMDFSVAIAQSGGMQIELIEQHCDRPSAYRDLVARGARGFHHIAFYPEDYDAAYAFYRGQGHVSAVDGVFGVHRFSYIDTSASIGCMVELIERNGVQSDFFDRIAKASADWDGRTDPIRPGFPSDPSTKKDAR